MKRGMRSDAGAPDASVAAAPGDLERTQAIWWYLLAVALVLMAAETVLSNRLSKAEGLGETVHGT